MARTAKKKISIYDDGVLLVEDVDQLDFAGAGVTGTNPIGNNVVETIPGGIGNLIFSEVVAGSGTAWTLAHTPIAGLALYANGQRLTLTVDYTIVGASITTLTSWAAGTVLADYQY